MEFAAPVSVYRERLRMLRHRMNERNISALLLFDQASLYYLFGYDQIGYWVFQCVVVSAEEDTEPLLICRFADRDIALEFSLLERFRPWSDTQDESPIEMVMEELARLNIRTGDVGVEMSAHSLVATYFSDLQRCLGPLNVSDATDLVLGMRQIKDEHEIAHYRQACKIMDAAFTRAREVIRPGIRECDILAEITYVMHSMGGDPPAISPPLASGRRTLTQTHGAATAKLVEDGDLLTLEVGASFRRYHAVGARSYSLGRPDAASSSVVDGLARALEDGLASTAPGDRACDLASRVQAGLRDRGLERAGRHVGYGIGIGFPPTWLEGLRIKGTESLVLDPGMTFFFFAGTHIDDSRYAVTGDPILVGESEFEYVSSIPRTFVVI